MQGTLGNIFHPYINHMVFHRRQSVLTRPINILLFSSLVSESDDQFLFEDMPELVSDESQAHEEEPEEVRLYQDEIDEALSDLKIGVSGRSYCQNFELFSYFLYV